MKKIINVVLIMLIVILVGFSAYQYNQIKGIKTNLQALEEEKTSLETSVAEKTTVIEEKDNKIKELEETVTKLEEEIGLLKEQITELEGELESLETEKVKTSERGSTEDQTSNATNPVPSSEGQLSDAEVNRLLEQYGIENAGSGNGTPATGSGGANWILQ